MQKFKLECLAILAGILAFNHNTFCMENNPKLNLTIPKVGHKSKNITENKNSKFIYDENGDFYCNQIFPFIKEQASALALRQTCNRMNLGFCKYSKYRPTKIKEVNRENITDFIKWLKENNKLGFYVALHLNNKYNSQKSYTRTAMDFIKGKNISNNKFKKILNLFGEKLKTLILSNFNAKSFSISELSSVIFSGLNITSISMKELSKTKLSSLKLDDFSNIFYISLDGLPETLESLTISGHFCKKFINDYLDEKNLENLPKNLKNLSLKYCNLKGSGFKLLPKNLETLSLSLNSIENLYEKYLSDLPKSIRKVYTKSDDWDVTNNASHKEIIAIIRKMGIIVVDE